MSESLTNGMVLIYFLYGLSFFVMGLTIAAESAMTRRFRLGSGLWMLAAFGMLHGLSEWLELLLDLELHHYPAHSLDYLAFIRLLVMAASFFCLIQFGVATFLRRQISKRTNSLLRVSAVALWGLFTVTLAAVVIMEVEQLPTVEIMVRYGAGLVGGLLAAYALFWQSRYLKETGRAGLSSGLFWSSIALAFYAFVEGGIGPEGSFWPASRLNETVFREAVGVPPEILRGGFALLTAFFVTKTFVVESRRALETAHQFLATLNESMKAITSSLNLDAVLGLIVQQATKASGARGGVLILSESDGQELLEKARYGDWQPSTLATIRPTYEYLFARAREAGAAVTLDRRRKSRSLPPHLGLSQLPYICAPITMSEKTMGAIVLVREPADHPFNDEDAQLVTALAAEAAIAIENARLYQYTWEMAITDALTGLRNYRYLNDRLLDEVSRATRYNHQFSIIASDCDLLKEVNDRYGHHEGDRLIQTIAQKMRESVRASDVVTRRAGDEFVILMPETSALDAAKIAERIRRAIDGVRIEIDDKRVGITVSLGVATFPDHAASAEELLHRADVAMYRAKAAGKNRIFIWEADLE